MQSLAIFLIGTKSGVLHVKTQFYSKWKISISRLYFARRKLSFAKFILFPERQNVSLDPLDCYIR